MKNNYFISETKDDYIVITSFDKLKGIPAGMCSKLFVLLPLHLNTLRL